MPLSHPCELLMHSASLALSSFFPTSASLSLSRDTSGAGSLLQRGQDCIIVVDSLSLSRGNSERSDSCINSSPDVCECVSRKQERDGADLDCRCSIASRLLHVRLSGCVCACLAAAGGELLMLTRRMPLSDFLCVSLSLHPSFAETRSHTLTAYTIPLFIIRLLSLSA